MPATLPYDPDQYIDDAFAYFDAFAAAAAAAQPRIFIFEGAGTHKLGRIYFNRMGDLARVFGDAAEGMVGANTLILTARPAASAPALPDGDYVLQRINEFGDASGEFVANYLNMRARADNPAAPLIRWEYPEGHKNMIDYICPDLASLRRLCQMTATGSRLGAQDLRGYTPPAVA